LRKEDSLEEEKNLKFKGEKCKNNTVGRCGNYARIPAKDAIGETLFFLCNEV
jgi:hypothetical protein